MACPGAAVCVCSGMHVMQRDPGWWVSHTVRTPVKNQEVIWQQCIQQSAGDHGKMVLDPWRPSELLPLLLGSRGTLLTLRPSALCGDISTLRASIPSNIGVLLHSASSICACLLLSWPTCVCTMWFGTYATCEKEEGNAAGPTLELSGPAGLLLERTSVLWKPHWREEAKIITVAWFKWRWGRSCLPFQMFTVQVSVHLKLLRNYSFFFESRCFNNKNACFLFLCAFPLIYFVVFAVTYVAFCYFTPLKFKRQSTVTLKLDAQQMFSR